MEKVNLSAYTILAISDDPAENAIFVKKAQNGFFTTKAHKNLTKAVREKVAKILDAAKVPLVISDEFAGGFGGTSNRPLFDAVGIVDFGSNGKIEKIETKVLVDRMYAIADFLTELAAKRGIVGGKGELLNVQIALKADGGVPKKA